MYKRQLLFVVLRPVDRLETPVLSDETPVLTDDRPVLTPVSYTHLDVYKRQVHGSEHDEQQRDESVDLDLDGPEHGDEFDR